ncbi:MAG: BCCT transporter [Lachnospiraceae bacterium]|nr:BCCT transporter [Lachnospiraceae bacterium]
MDKNKREENMSAASDKGINLTLKQAFERGIRPAVILVPVIIFVTLIAIGIVDSGTFLTMLNAFFSSLMVNGSWLVSIGTLGFVLFMLLILVHPIGKVKLGGKDAKPEYSLWNWFAISLCAGIGTGIVFWGAVEPLRFAVEPQLSTGITPNTRESVIWSLSKSYLHWSFAPYATYVIFGIIIAYAYYNLHKSYSISSGFAPLLGATSEKKWFRGIIDTLTVFAITGGVAGSLGYGLLQIGSGLNTVFGIPAETPLYVGICVVIVVAYNTSSITGMDKGIKWLSDKNAWMFLILMVLAFLAGPSQWICNLLTESLGSFLPNFFESITAVSAFTDAGEVAGSVWHKASEMWPQWWDEYYFVDFLSFGPITGLFLIKLAKGRTLREFVVINWVVPSFFGIIWFAIFGGLSLDIQYNYAAYAGRVNLEGCASLFDYMQQYGNEAMMLKVIEAIPLAFIIKPIILVLIILSFVTLADSMTSTVSLMTIKNNIGVNEAPAQIKLMWGLIMGVTSLVFTLTGGLEGIKIVKTIAGFPILIVGIAMMIMFIVYIIKHGKDKEVKDMMAD